MIKLTEKHMWVNSDDVLTITAYELTRAQMKELKQQILDNQEKAEKYDSDIDLIGDLSMQNISLKEENKQLKEKIQKITDICDDSKHNFFHAPLRDQIIEVLEE